MDVVELVKRHEGLRLKPYIDPAALPRVAAQYRISVAELKEILSHESVTIGYGRNLGAEGISEREAEGLLTNDLAAVTARLSELEVWKQLDEVRQSVLVDMAFNLGYLGLMGFHGMFDALAAGDYKQAAVHIRQSKADSQAPNRYNELAWMMLTGQWPKADA